MSTDPIDIPKLCALLNQYDELPPDSEYSASEHGEDIAAQVANDHEAALIVEAVLDTLYINLANNFLSGFLSVQNSETVQESLYTNLCVNRALTGAANVVDLLCKFFQLEEKAAFAMLKSRLARCNRSTAQDQICFAIWTLICGEVLDVRMGALKPKPTVTDVAELKEILRDNALTTYSVEVLQNCIVKLSAQHK